MSEDDDILKYTPPKRLKLVGVIVLVAACGIVVSGIVSRERASATPGGSGHGAGGPDRESRQPICRRYPQPRAAGRHPRL